MFKRLKKTFWNFIIPKLEKKLLKASKIRNSEFKENLFKKLQSKGFNVFIKGDNYFISHIDKVIFGNNVILEENVKLYSEGGIVVGDNTYISNSVTIYTKDCYIEDAKFLPIDTDLKYRSVLIGKNVWIGMNALILPGIVIGDGAIVMEGSVVNRDVKKNEVVGNTSLTHIKFRNKEHYQNLENNKKYSGFNGKPLANYELNSYLPSYSKNRNEKIIFILSTGRSGSKSIVDILNQNPNIKAFHEDIKQIIRISTELAYNSRGEEKSKLELNKIFETKIWQALKGQTLIHSDQRLWNLVPFLSEYFPNSKFIHLYREPLSCVKSMFVRSWYSKNEYPNANNHDWAKYRLQANKLGIFSDKVWEDHHPIEKCIWYWNFINETIFRNLSKLNRDRTLSVDIGKIENELPIISNFINQDNFIYHKVETNQMKSIHKEKYQSVDDEKIKIMVENYLSNNKNKFNKQFLNRKTSK